MGIKQHYDITVKGIPVRLRQAGYEFHALCPFHEEKTPSFTVKADLKTYHCFGCGAKGNVDERITLDEGQLRVATKETLSLADSDAPAARAFIAGLHAEGKISADHYETVLNLIDGV